MAGADDAKEPKVYSSRFFGMTGVEAPRRTQRGKSVAGQRGRSFAERGKSIGGAERGRSFAERGKSIGGDGGAGGWARRKRRTYVSDGEGGEDDEGGSLSGSFSANNQQLFLVEFLIDTVCIDTCSVDSEVLEGQTCISLSFLNFPPMEICEKDFDPNKNTDLEKARFNCGKSLMFAFNESQCERPPPLVVEITVLKKLGEGEEAVRVEIGVIKICISELFRQIIDTAKYNPEKLPTSKSIKDCFMLIGPGKRTMGEVSVYIRLSCLGENVVTEFQCGSDMKSSPILFKSREGKKMFEFTGAEGSAPEGEVVPMGPTASPGPPSGGQGDDGTASPVTTAYTKGSKVVLDIQAKKKSPGGKKCKGKVKQVTDGRPLTELYPDQNVFVLKVGDKGQIPDRGKMILEFRTPKQKIPPKVIPPYHEDVAVQTETGKKNGKGKKKK